MNKKNYVYNITLSAILFAISLVLSLVENILPPVMFGVPGLRLGLSNIVVMFSIIYINAYTAIFIAVLKSFFVFLIRGAVAGFLSFSGGIASALLMLLLILIFRDKISLLLLSIVGAITHSLFQVIAIILIMHNFYFVYYMPVLVVFGCVSGSITSVILINISKSTKLKELYKK